MLSRYEHSSPYFSIVTYIIPTLLGRLRHLPFVQKMLDNALIHEVCIMSERERESKGFLRIIFFLDLINLSMFKWLSFLPCHHFDRLLPFYPPGAYTGVGRGLYLLQQQQESSAKVYFIIVSKIQSNSSIKYFIFIFIYFS
jgi:hypothetical protein